MQKLPLTAAGGNSSAARRARAALQWRDRFGRWVEMGRGIKFKVRLGTGATVSVNGKFVGATDNPEMGQVYVSKDPNGLKDGFYDVKSSNGQEILASLDPADLAKSGIEVGKDANGNPVGERTDADIQDQATIGYAEAPTGWNKTGEDRYQTDDQEFSVAFDAEERPTMWHHSIKPRAFKDWPAMLAEVDEVDAGTSDWDAKYEAESKNSDVQGNTANEAARSAYTPTDEEKAAAKQAVSDWDSDGLIAARIDSGAGSDEIAAELDKNIAFRAAKEDYDSRLRDPGTRADKARWAAFEPKQKALARLSGTNALKVGRPTPGEAPESAPETPETPEAPAVDAPEAPEAPASEVDALGDPIPTTPEELQKRLAFLERRVDRANPEDPNFDKIYEARDQIQAKLNAPAEPEPTPEATPEPDVTTEPDAPEVPEAVPTPDPEPEAPIDVPPTTPEAPAPDEPEIPGSKRAADLTEGDIVDGRRVVKAPTVGEDGIASVLTTDLNGNNLSSTKYDPDESVAFEPTDPVAQAAAFKQGDKVQFTDKMGNVRRGTVQNAGNRPGTVNVGLEKPRRGEPVSISLDAYKLTRNEPAPEPVEDAPEAPVTPDVAPEAPEDAPEAPEAPEAAPAEPEAAPEAETDRVAELEAERNELAGKRKTKANLARLEELDEEIRDAKREADPDNLELYSDEELDAEIADMESGALVTPADERHLEDLRAERAQRDTTETTPGADDVLLFDERDPEWQAYVDALDAEMGKPAAPSAEESVPEDAPVEEAPAGPDPEAAARMAREDEEYRAQLDAQAAEDKALIDAMREDPNFRDFDPAAGEEQLGEPTPDPEVERLKEVVRTGTPQRTDGKIGTKVPVGQERIDLINSARDRLADMIPDAESDLRDIILAGKDAPAGNDAELTPEQIDALPNKANTTTTPRPNAPKKVTPPANELDPSSLPEDGLIFGQLMQEYPDAEILENGDIFLESHQKNGRSYDIQVRRTGKERFYVYVQETDWTQGVSRVFRYSKEKHSFTALQSEIGRAQTRVNDPKKAPHLWMNANPDNVQDVAEDENGNFLIPAAPELAEGGRPAHVAYGGEVSLKPGDSVDWTDWKRTQPKLDEFGQKMYERNPDGSRRLVRGEPVLVTEPNPTYGQVFRGTVKSLQRVDNGHRGADVDYDYSDHVYVVLPEYNRIRGSRKPESHQRDIVSSNLRVVSGPAEPIGPAFFAKKEEVGKPVLSPADFGVPRIGNGVTPGIQIPRPPVPELDQRLLQFAHEGAKLDDIADIRADARVDNIAPIEMRVGDLIPLFADDRGKGVIMRKIVDVIDLHNGQHTIVTGAIIDGEVVIHGFRAPSYMMLSVFRIPDPDNDPNEVIRRLSPPVSDPDRPAPGIIARGIDEIDAWAEKLREKYESGVERVAADLGYRGALNAGAQIVETTSGDRVFVKRAASDMDYDAEVLGNKLSNAIGITDIALVGYPNAKEVAMTVAPGRRASEDPKRSMPVIKGDIETRNGRLIGLLDYLIQMGDRHSGNWFIADDNEPVPIDQGLAWYSSAETDSMFTRLAVGQANNPTKETINFTVDELLQIRENIVAIKPRFDEMNRSTWYAKTINRVDKLISILKGE